MQDPNGFTDHEILIKVLNKVEDLDTYVRTEFGNRPTRGEVMGLFGGAGVLSGIIFGALRLLGHG